MNQRGWKAIQSARQLIRGAQRVPARRRQRPSRRGSGIAASRARRLQCVPRGADSAQRAWAGSWSHQCSAASRSGLNRSSRSSCRVNPSTRVPRNAPCTLAIASSKSLFSERVMPPLVAASAFVTSRITTLQPSRYRDLNLGQGTKRLKGLEPSTFCMASRRSSQLSYSRKRAISIPALPRAPGGYPRSRARLTWRSASVFSVRRTST